MSFYRETGIRCTRKPHRCNWCNRLIPKGDQAVNWASHWEGDFCSGHFHPECSKAAAEVSRKDGEVEFTGDYARGRTDERHDFPPEFPTTLDVLVPRPPEHSKPVEIDGVLHVYQASPIKKPC